jgi:hypothetical protein
MTSDGLYVDATLADGADDDAGISSLSAASKRIARSGDAENEARQHSKLEEKLEPPLVDLHHQGMAAQGGITHLMSPQAPGPAGSATGANSRSLRRIAFSSRETCPSRAVGGCPRLDLEADSRAIPPAPDELLFVRHGRAFP